LGSKPYYDKIIFTSTSDGLDKTVQTIEGEVQSNIQFVPDTDILEYLTNYMKEKKEFYALVQYIQFNKLTTEMEKLIEEHKLYQWNRTRTGYVPDPKRISLYFTKKMEEWDFKSYPSNTLLILDDFAGHPLFRKVESPLNRLFTKTRHYNLTVILSVQSWIFVNLNFKRLCTDIIIYQGYSQEDFEKMIKQTPNGLEFEPLWEEYRKLTDPHSKLVVNITAHKATFS
jgi:hypothetical protein